MSASLISHTCETHRGLSLLTNVSGRTTPEAPSAKPCTRHLFAETSNATGQIRDIPQHSHTPSSRLARRSFRNVGSRFSDQRILRNVQHLFLRLARDDGGKNFELLAWRGKVVVLCHVNHPVCKAINQFLASEHVLFAGSEHVQVCCALNQHIHDRAPAGPHVCLDIPEHRECAGLRKEHQQADCNNGVVVVSNAKTRQIHFESLHGQLFFLCGIANSRDCGGARVDGCHSTAAACGL